jgi:acetylornithine deacetylase/succinyl-diaminopimelate desuccinylase-like protein
MAHLMAAGEVAPGAVVIGEATGGDVCIGHRGRAELVVQVRGVAGHASAPERARNALDGVGPVLDALRSFVDDRLAAEDPVLGRATLVPTDVAARPASRNVIPDAASIILDWRMLPGLDADDAVALVRDYLTDRVRLPDGLSLQVEFSSERQHTWTGMEATRRMFSPGFLLDPDHPIATGAADAVASSTGVRPRIRPWRFATDGGHTCGAAGIPTIGYAPGEERFAHTNVERLELEGARVAYDAYPALIRGLFGILA